MGVPEHIKNKGLKEDADVRGDDFFSRKVVAYVLLLFVIMLSAFGSV